MVDYSKSIFAPGIVCYNTNNFTKCVVLDGNRGDENDRCSLVLELFSDGIHTHTPPNRALIPTGEYLDFTAAMEMLTISANEFKEKVFGGNKQ